MQVTLDFETDAITAPPALDAPRPCGMGYAVDDNPPIYMPITNEMEMQDAAGVLSHFVDANALFIGHNIEGFDRHVAEQHLGVPLRRCADTRHLAAIGCPREPSLSLKNLAETVLGVVPEERNAIREWLVEHKIVTRTQKNWGAHIAEAPQELIEPYCKADVSYSRRLFKHITERLDYAEQQAVRREMLLAPILNDMTRRGVRVDRQRLLAWRHNYGIELERADAEIRASLGCPDLNIDSNDDLADALEAAGQSRGFPRTPTGKRKVDKASLELAVIDDRLKQVLKYRNLLSTYLHTFIDAWILMSAKAPHRIHPEWDAVRGDEGGTRTGRIACHRPNLMNVPKEAEMSPPPGYLPLPNLRRALLPERGHAWVSADFNGQELRGLAHFVMGALEEAYKANPNLDLHTHAAKLIEEKTGRKTDRKMTKIIAFSIIYGAGNAALAARLGCSVDEAFALRMAYYDALPGVREFIEDVKERARRGEPVRTWGGRKLYAPAGKDGHGVRDYALVNYLIQGTCADLTKDALVDFQARGTAGLLLPTVHDEINVSIPQDDPEKFGRTILALQEAMVLPRLEVPMTVEITSGVSWGDLR